MPEANRDVAPVVYGECSRFAQPGTFDEIRGLLVLPAIWLVFALAVGPLRMLGDIASLVSIFGRTPTQLTAFRVLALYANVALYVCLWDVAMKFFRKRRSTPVAVMEFMLARILVSAVMFGLGWAMVEGNAQLTSHVLPQLGNLVRAAIVAAIWIPYFALSKRVRATFVN